MVGEKFYKDVELKVGIVLLFKFAIMIPHVNRLSHTSLIQPETISTPLFIAKVKPNTLSYPRFAFVVSKKIDKRAVVRNKLKRILRERVFSLCDLHAGYDMVFVVRSNFSDLSTELVDTAIQEVFTKSVRV